MQTTKTVVLCAMVIVQTLKAQNVNHKFYIEGQLSAGSQSASFVGGVGGALGIFFSERHSLDIRAKEVFNFSNHDIVGPITLTYRYNFKCGIYLGGGFAHHHEVGKHTYMDHPMESMMGSHRDIFHRTGMAMEVGYNFKPMAKKGFFSGLYPAAGISVTHMIGDAGRNPLITANIGIRIGIKKNQPVK